MKLFVELLIGLISLVKILYSHTILPTIIEKSELDDASQVIRSSKVYSEVTTSEPSTIGTANQSEPFSEDELFFAHVMSIHAHRGGVSGFTPPP